MGCGALLLALSSLLGLAYLLAALLARADPSLLGLSLMTGGLALLTSAAGFSLLTVGVAGSSTLDSQAEQTAAPWTWLLAFASILLLGQAVLAMGPGVSAVALPPLHFVAAALPAWALSRRLAWRIQIARLLYGGCAATSVALAIEAVLATAVLAMVLFALWQAPESHAALETLQAALRRGEALVWNEKTLAPLVTPLSVAAAFVVFGLVGPAVEELAKVVGVALWRPPSARQAWLQGLAIGAGFGITEAITLGATGGTFWPLTMAVRATATLMHAAMSGVAALGWFALARQKRIVLGLAGLGAAIIGHGVWNSLILGTGLAGLAVRSSAMARLAAVSSSGLALAWLGIVFGCLLVDARLRLRAPPA